MNANAPRGLNVLLLGSGGREHALAWKMLQSPSVGQMWALPGNPGIAADGATCIQGDSTDFEQVKAVLLQNAIDLLVVGPEGPIVAGIEDFCAHDPALQQIAVLAPSKAAAQLEGSKSFAKAFMVRHGIPTAQYRVFTATQHDEARAFLRELRAPYVLKADGLAGGKGVLIAETLNEAESALGALLGGQFGEASRTVVIEEFLEGIEMSLFVLTDGADYVLLPAAKDYKRALDGDRGLNTGGMGSVSPVPFADQALMARIVSRIVEPTLQGLQAEKLCYRGFIFLGLMVDRQGAPYVIEYNVRLGDPETQVVLPRVEGDFLQALYRAARGELKGISLGHSPAFCTSVSLTSAGYPESYRKGMPITLPELTERQLLFHAGTASKGDQLVTSGGRVLSACGVGQSLQNALDSAYHLARGVHFDGVTYRSDIGQDLR